MQEKKVAIDAQIVEQIKRKNTDAFRLFVERYQKRLYFMCFDLTGNHHDAEDLSQDVFIKVFRSAHQLRDNQDIEGWLYRIAVNAFLDKKRKRINRILRFWLDAEDQNIDSIDSGSTHRPDTATDESLIRHHIQKALKKLSVRERAVFVLRHYQDYSLYEIAQTLSIAEGTVKSLLFRAAKKLRPLLANCVGQIMEDAR
jgi:RNA polymerase sigma-70 factor (ECF subfamily)